LIFRNLVSSLAPRIKHRLHGNNSCMIFVRIRLVALLLYLFD